MALAQIDTGLTSLEAAYAERLHRWQEMAIQNIRKQIQTSTSEDALTTGIKVGAVSELSNDLINLRTRIANFGRGQLNQELQRQMR